MVGGNVIILKLLIKFLIVGASGVVVNLIIYSVLIYFNINYILAASLAFIFAVTNNFFWNFIWTFKGEAVHKSVKRKYFEFFAISLFNFFINISLLRIMVEAFYVDKILAQIIAIAITSLLNFTGNYLFTFKNKKP